MCGYVSSESEKDVRVILDVSWDGCTCVVVVSIWKFQRSGCDWCTSLN